MLNIIIKGREEKYYMNIAIVIMLCQYIWFVNNLKNYKVYTQRIFNDHIYLQVFFLLQLPCYFLICS